jgi:hypothetical protein
MTSLQIYLLVAPFVLLAIAGAATYWWVVRDDHGHHPAE